jgi:hypothetical protein
MIFFNWILFYVVPASVATYIRNKQPSVVIRLLLMGAFMGASAVFLSLLGARLSWNFEWPWLIAFLIGALITIKFLGTGAGLFYVIGCAVQEICLLLSGVFLFPVTGLVISAILTAIPFTFSHFAPGDWPARRGRFPILFIWGMISVTLYFWIKQPLFNIILHAAAGAFLIRKGILYQAGKGVNIKFFKIS